jgi:hypothetical protein
MDNSEHSHEELSASMNVKRMRKENVTSESLVPIYLIDID